MTITVQGRLITDAQCEAMLARMKAGPFRASDIEKAALEAGVPARAPDFRYNGGTAHRAADNLIQRERKAQRIRLVKNGPMWEPVPAG